MTLTEVMKMTNEDRGIYRKAISQYGGDNQVIVAIEELSELQKELCKHLRGNTNTEHIAEEMADCEIMLDQLKMIFCNNELIDMYHKQKIQRLNMRLEK